MYILQSCVCVCLSPKVSSLPSSGHPTARFDDLNEESGSFAESSCSWHRSRLVNSAAHHRQRVVVVQQRSDRAKLIQPRLAPRLHLTCTWQWSPFELCSFCASAHRQLSSLWLLQQPFESPPKQKLLDAVRLIQSNSLNANRLSSLLSANSQGER